MLTSVLFLLLVGFSPVTTYSSEDYAAYSQSSLKNPAWDPLVKEGFDAMDRQDITTSIEFLRKAVIAGCISPIVLFKLALGYETTGSYYSAVQYYNLAREGFKKANQDHRYYKQFPENYGRAIYMLGQTDKAIPILEGAAGNLDCSPWVLKFLGQVYLAKKDPGKASDYFTRYAAKGNVTTPELIDMHLGLARAFNAGADPDNAVKHYQEVAALDPSNQEAQTYLRQKKSNHSLDHLFEMMGN